MHLVHSQRIIFGIWCSLPTYFVIGTRPTQARCIEKSMPMRMWRQSLKICYKFGATNRGVAGVDLLWVQVEIWAPGKDHMQPFGTDPSVWASAKWSWSIISSEELWRCERRTYTLLTLSLYNFFITFVVFWNCFRGYSNDILFASLFFSKISHNWNPYSTLEFGPVK